MSLNNNIQLSSPSYQMENLCSVLDIVSGNHSTLSIFFFLAVLKYFIPTSLDCDDNLLMYLLLVSIFDRRFGQKLVP